MRMNRFKIPWWNTAFAALFGCVSLIAVNTSAQAPPSPPSRLTAEATNHDTIELKWSGPKTDHVDIYRGDSLLTTPEANDGSYTDNIIRKGDDSYLYKVCEMGSDTCSNIAGVVF
jgi:hypothetical protein